MTTPTTEDPTRTKWAHRFHCVDTTEMIAARSLGAALIDIESLFIELAEVYDADNFDEQGEEAKRLVSAAVAIALKCSESAKGYLEYCQPGLRSLMLES